MISNLLIMHCLYVMNLWVRCLYSKAAKSKNFSAGFQEKSFKKVECMGVEQTVEVLLWNLCILC